jgi:hypothetical protein
LGIFEIPMKPTLLFLLLSSSCFAQTFIKAGIALSRTSNPPPSGTVHRRAAGFVGGVAVNRQWSDRTAVRTELLFIQKGDRLTSQTEELKLRINYVEVPVLFVFSPSSLRQAVVLALEFGPSFGYGLGGKYWLMSPLTPQQGAVVFGEPTPNAPSQNLYLDNALDIGLQLGGALTIKQRLLLDFRYGFGLMSMTKPPDPLPAGRKTSDYISKNGALQFSLGWRMGRKE